MGGSSIEEDWDFPSLSNAARTVVLVGRTGNGKSATGNSILGKKVFKSRASSSGVTSSSELQSTMLRDGQVIHVIDTPGEESLFKVTSSEPQSKAPVSGTTEFETSAYLVYSVDHAAKNLIKNHL